MFLTLIWLVAVAASPTKQEERDLQQIFNNGLKIGDGNWKFTKDRIEVYSWSYGLPAMLVFGEPVEYGTLQATMKDTGFGPNGFQGLVICATREVKQDDGYHGSAAYFIRYNRGMIELLDSIPYHKSPTPTHQLASVPTEIKVGSDYTLRIAVQDGNLITVWLDGKNVLEYAAKNKLSGKYALLAANGSYVFSRVAISAW